MSCLNSSAPDVSSAWNSFLRTCLDLIVLNFLNLYLKVNFLMRLSQTILLKIKFLTPFSSKRKLLVSVLPSLAAVQLYETFRFLVFMFLILSILEASHLPSEVL